MRGYDAEMVSTLDWGAHPEWHPGLGSAEDTGPEGKVVRCVHVRATQIVRLVGMTSQREREGSENTSY